MNNTKGDFCVLAIHEIGVVSKANIFLFLKVRLEFTFESWGCLKKVIGTYNSQYICDYRNSLNW